MSTSSDTHGTKDVWQYFNISISTPTRPDDLPALGFEME